MATTNKECAVLNKEDQNADPSIIKGRCGEFRECRGCLKLDGKSPIIVAVEAMVGRVTKKISLIS